MTKEQADAFLRALWPAGEMDYLSSHARTYLEAHVGHVPRSLPYTRTQTNDIEACQSLGGVLVDIGNALMSAAMEANTR